MIQPQQHGNMPGFQSAEQQNARTDEAVVDLEQDNDRPVGFLDLSPELRNMVYEHLLPPDRKLQIGFHPSTKEQMIPSYSEPPLVLVRLACTNSQLNAEIAPMVYTSIAFLDVDAPTVQWLKGIGSMKRLIRHANVGHCSRRYLKSLLHQLKQADSLRSLTIGYHARTAKVWYEADPEDMAKVLHPFVKARRKAKQGTNAKHDTIQMILTEPCPYRRIIPSPDEYEVKLHAKLDELLS